MHVIHPEDNEKKRKKEVLYWIRTLALGFTFYKHTPLSFQPNCHYHNPVYLFNKSLDAYRNKTINRLQQKLHRRPCHIAICKNIDISPTFNQEPIEPAREHATGACT